MKLRTNLYLVVLGAVVPFLVLAAVMLYLKAERDQELAQRAAQDRVRAVMSAVDTELLGIMGRLRALSGSSALARGDFVTFRREAERLVAHNPSYRTIVVIGRDGAHLMNTRDPTQLLRTPTEPASFYKVLETASPVVGNIGWATVSREYAFTVRVPVVEGGMVRYVVTSLVTPALFQQLLQGQQQEEGQVLGLTDATGHFVARLPYLDPTQSGSPGFLSHARASQSGWYRGRTVEGVDTFTAHITSQLSGWMLGHAIPVSQVYASVWRSIAYAILGLVLVTAIALAIAYAMARRIIRPVARLTQYAGTVLDAKATAAHAPRIDIDEIDDLRRVLDEAGKLARERQRATEREQEALRAADKAKTEFLAMLSHELRNPLAAIASASGVIKRSQKPELIAHTNAIIERQSRHMARLVNDLLDMSRLATGKVAIDRVPLDLSKLAQSELRAWEGTDRLGAHRLRLSAEPDVWVRGDGSRLQQVLSNLIDNAVKFSPAGSRVEISVRKSADEALLQVADEGEGISPEMLPRVFELFVQEPQDLARSRGGMGIGLSIVKQLVELHGGRVAVETRGKGHGTIFTVKLPRTETPQPGEPAHTVLQGPTSLRIAVVDDNADFRTALLEVLSLEGHEALGFGDATEALGSEFVRRCDLALIDIGLPDMTGSAVAARLRHNPSRPFLVAVTGYSMDADRNEAMESGFDLFITKPPTDEMLHEAIARAREHCSHAAPRSGS